MLVIKPKGGVYDLPRSDITITDANVEAATERALLETTGLHLNEILDCLPLHSVVVEGRATGAILTFVATCNEVFNIASTSTIKPLRAHEGDEFDWVHTEQEIAQIIPRQTRAFNTMKDAFWCRTRTWLSTMTYLDLPYKEATDFIADFDYSVAIAVVRPRGKGRDMAVLSQGGNENTKPSTTSTSTEPSTAPSNRSGITYFSPSRLNTSTNNTASPTTTTTTITRNTLFPIPDLIDNSDLNPTSTALFNHAAPSLLLLQNPTTKVWDLAHAHLRPGKDRTVASAVRDIVHSATGLRVTRVVGALQEQPTITSHPRSVGEQLVKGAVRFEYLVLVADPGDVKGKGKNNEKGPVGQEATMAQELDLEAVAIVNRKVADARWVQTVEDVERMGCRKGVVRSVRRALRLVEEEVSLGMGGLEIGVEDGEWNENIGEEEGDSEDGGYGGGYGSDGGGDGGGYGAVTSRSPIGSGEVRAARTVNEYLSIGDVKGKGKKKEKDGWFG